MYNIIIINYTINKLNIKFKLNINIIKDIRFFFYDNIFNRNNFKIICLWNQNIFYSSSK